MPSQRLASAEDIAGELAVSVDTIQRLTAAGLPHYRVGHQLRFSRAEVLGYLQRAGDSRDVGAGRDPVRAWVAHQAGRHALAGREGTRTPGATPPLLPTTAHMWHDAGASAAASTIDGISERQSREHAALPPAPRLVVGLVETIPTDGQEIHEAGWSAPGAPSARGRDSGQPLPEMAGALTGARQSLVRFGVQVPVHEDNLADAELAERFLRRLLIGDIAAGLGDELVTGDGTTEVEADGTTRHLEGLAAHPITTVAVDTAGGEIRYDAVQRGAEQVETDGWVHGRLTAVGSPATLRRIRTMRSADGTVLTPTALQGDPVQAWVPSSAVPDGEVYVGDWFAAVALFVGTAGVTVDFDAAPDQQLVLRLFGQHLSFPEEGLVLASMRTFVWAWVRHPSALRRVTGL